MGENRAQTTRPRRYELPVPVGFADPVVARYAAALDELSERHFDLIADLPAAALDFLPAGAPSTIAMITGHLAQGEAFWVTRLIGVPLDPALAKDVAAARTSRPSPFNAQALIQLCRRTRAEHTVPALAAVTDAAGRINDADRVLTPAGVLMHLIWHWTYHNGQTGLLRMQAGHGYNWGFHPRVTGFASVTP